MDKFLHVLGGVLIAVIVIGAIIAFVPGVKQTISTNLNTAITSFTTNSNSYLAGPAGK